ncbi:hypothetical protein BDR03DRAFT_969115, partial [Suillus americanus]
MVTTLISAGSVTYGTYIIRKVKDIDREHIEHLVFNQASPLLLSLSTTSLGVLLHTLTCIALLVDLAIV